MQGGQKQACSCKRARQLTRVLLDSCAVFRTGDCKLSPLCIGVTLNRKTTNYRRSETKDIRREVKEQHTTTPCSQDRLKMQGDRKTDVEDGKIYTVKTLTRTGLLRQS